VRNEASLRSKERKTAPVWFLALATALALQACGGGGEEDPASSVPEAGADPAPAPAPVPEPNPALAVTTEHCFVVPRMPAVSGTVRSVAEFGAVPGDSGDDTAAIQRALDGMKSGETLVFPAGRYLTNKRLRVRVPGTTLRGDGATLHATNPDDTALIVQADNTSIFSFTFTAVTDVRRGAPWHSRIAVWYELPNGGGLQTIRNTVIQGNTITHAGAPGTPLANSSSAGGIMLLRADGFLIADNSVDRTLADGIHLTSGSRNGRVLNNTVRETGDDMIAVVSYAGNGPAALSSAAKLKANWSTRVEQKLNRNILIAGNNVSGQYWGRGITVVGGRSISIRRNRIDNVPLGAAILLAREANYETFGVNDVLVSANQISNVQNRAPAYDVGGKYASHRPFGHGAIELHSSQFADEAADAQMKVELSVRDVKLLQNTISITAVPALRAGVGFSGSEQATDPISGAVVSRSVRTALLASASVQGNRFDGVPGEAMSVRPAGVAADGVHCNANTRDGQAYSHPACTRAEPVVRGAFMTCSSGGKVTS
jgi:parallel beta-helix repeat protein